MAEIEVAYEYVYMPEPEAQPDAEESVAPKKIKPKKPLKGDWFCGAFTMLMGLFAVGGLILLSGLGVGLYKVVRRYTSGESGGAS